MFTEVYLLYGLILVEEIGPENLSGPNLIGLYSLQLVL